MKTTKRTKTATKTKPRSSTTRPAPPRVFDVKITHAWRYSAGLSAGDFRTALALLKYLDKAHRAALYLPGMDEALSPRTEGWGPHTHQSSMLVGDLLLAGTRYCEDQITELESKAKAPTKRARASSRK
jgi:hypothetical protein